MERGKLAKAQECLQHAHQLAPSEDYILRHLQIVQTRIAKLKQTAGMSKEKEIAFAEFDPKDFGGNILSKPIDVVDVDGDNDNADTKNTIPSPIVLDVPDGKKETQKSVSKQEKPHQSPPKHIPDTKLHQQTKHGEDPMFIESAEATIEEEYRPSNSVQNGVNRRRYHDQLHSHVPSSHHRQSLVGNDRDDPSSGMS